MSYPTTSSASDVWSLRDVYKAEAGGDWPLPFPPPTAPDTVTAQAGDTEATVTFSGQVTYGDSPTFTVTSSPGGITATGGSSPITVTGLTNGTEYTFTVTVTDSGGRTATSSASNAVTPFASEGSWSLTDGLDDIYDLYFDGTAYSGAGITQSNLEALFNDTNFQDVNASDRTLAYMNVGGNVGDSITISYNAPGTTQASFYLQRWSGTNVDFTVSGSISVSGNVGSGGTVFNAAAPESGTFTITTTNATPGLAIWSISFNGVTPGNLTYG